jgi:hypothetical protein
MKTGYVPHNMTGIYPDWDTINIWMDRDPIQIHENANERMTIAKLSELGQTPDLDVTHPPGKYWVCPRDALWICSCMRPPAVLLC